MESSKFYSMIRLLEDPDRVVYQEVAQTLLHEGEFIIPRLEEAWEKHPNPFIQGKIENIIQNIQFSSLQSEFRSWIDFGGKDLLKGAFWLAKYQYPNLNLFSSTREIEDLITEVNQELSHKHTPLEKIRILNNYIFIKYGFAKTKSETRFPKDFFINHVLERKCGNSTTLSIIYATIAQKLGLPIFCVNLPSNSILAYVNQSALRNTYFPENDHNVAFYINPINFGEILGKREIDYFLNQLNIEPKTSYYLPCSNIEMINQLLSNLILSYERVGQLQKVEDLKVLGNLIYKNNSSY